MVVVFILSDEDDNNVNTELAEVADCLNKYFTADDSPFIRIEYDLIVSSANGAPRRRTTTAGFARYVSKEGVRSVRDYESKVLFEKCGSAAIPAWHVFHPPTPTTRYYAKKGYVCERVNGCNTTTFLYLEKSNVWKILQHYFDEGSVTSSAKITPFDGRFRDIKIGVNTKSSLTGFTDFSS